MIVLSDASAQHDNERGNEPVGFRERGLRLAQPETVEWEIPHPVVARLALEVLWQELFYTRVPGTLEPEEKAVEKSLDTMHAMLWRKEMQAVADTALTAHYLIIRPINPLHMPGPEETAEIAGAIATLERHGLIARTWTDD
jgi:hypothetical protein